jgi:hypothetical protein
MQANIKVTKASVSNGWRNIVDDKGVRYSLSKKGNVPDLFVGQNVTITYTEKMSDDGKFTNRYITAWTPAGAGQGQARMVGDQNPYEQAPSPSAPSKPLETHARALPDDVSRRFETTQSDPKGDSMAKMNAMNNAVAMEIAKLNFFAASPDDERPGATLAFKHMEVKVWENAGKIYWVLTGKAWPEMETRQVQDRVVDDVEDFGGPV